MADRDRKVKIRAWAVVCASGRFHRRDHERHRLVIVEEAAKVRQLGCDSFMGDPCGPHTVVPLTGVYTVKGEKKGRK